MQDLYVGDIGDYGKYILLRKVTDENLTLSINWYKVVPMQKSKQNDGKFIKYLSEPQKYRKYDIRLFDVLNEIVNVCKNRTIKQVEDSQVLNAKFYSEALQGDRDLWHAKALQNTDKTQVVFLDPDNGLETENMFLKNTGENKHVFWQELKDYYDRGQNVILYQHRPQMMKKNICVERILNFQNSYLCADDVKLIEFPQYTNRFYFMFLHRDYSEVFDRICTDIAVNMAGFCLHHPLKF